MVTLAESIQKIDQIPYPSNHKGEPCYLDGRLCQEGYCQNCIKADPEE